MNFLVLLASLIFLMLIAYRGYSVILFAIIAAMAAVFLTDPALVAPMFSNLFMVKMADFVKNYFPVFLICDFMMLLVSRLITLPLISILARLSSTTP